ncbi:CaiB/BaiF CoA transferase family protein [Pelagibacterium limicola]|uniref:CaiB/BaiF CoA transferase family protein n=1 Tax=Pelagibacterium limicola TaxID=2791022 RepID=UPI0018AF84EE|nr:CoA transferase [Pelagibacterium limicola]
MSLPLEGLSVIDFSKFLPGPYCTWLLADMGADVIRIENPREIAKQAKVFGWDRLSDQERLRLRETDILARNKRSIMLEIGDDKALEAIKALVATADIVVEDYRPGVLASLGLGYDALSADNSRLIYASLTLCGQSGPYRDKPGHDPIALSIAGVQSRVGEDPEAPNFAGIPAADVITGTHAAFAILAALRAREMTGHGQHLDVAMSDCAMSLLVNVLSRHPDVSQIPPRGSRRADMGLWKTRDGSFLCTTDMEPRYWAKFCEAVGRSDLIPEQHNTERRAEIRSALEEIFASKDRAEWLEILGAAGTQFAPVLSVAEALTDPHNQARGMVISHPGSDGRAIRQLGQPVRVGGETRIANLGRAPGADTIDILSGIGLDTEQIKQLSGQGA